MFLPTTSPNTKGEKAKKGEFINSCEYMARLTYSFTMHPFSTPGGGGGRERVHWEQMG